MKKILILISCLFTLALFAQKMTKAQIQAEMDKLSKELEESTRTTNTTQKGVPNQTKGTTSAGSAVEIAKLKERINALKQDSAFIHEKLAYFEKLNTDTSYQVSGFSSQFDVKILSCKGDRSAQTVQIEFVIKHKKVNQRAYIENEIKYSNAYDEIGNMYEVSESTLGANRSGGWMFLTTIPTDIDVRGTVTIRRVIGGTEKFKLVNIYVLSKDFDGGTNEIQGAFSIKNLKINW